MTYKFRRKQNVWTQHKVYGWVQGKIEDRWEFDGKPHYRIVVLKAGTKTADMLITATEHHFHKERP